MADDTRQDDDAPKDDDRLAAGDQYDLAEPAAVDLDRTGARTGAQPGPLVPPPPAAPRCYVLNCNFGEYKPDDVVPAYVVETGHDAKALVERGLVTPTDAPPTVEVKAPAATPPTPAQDVYQERNHWQREADRLANDNKLLDGRAKELERHNDSLKAELGKYASDAGHRDGAAADLRAKLAAAEERAAAAEAERDQLKAELDSLTAPE